ncbi:MAG: hypothetical protein LQ350_003019 [Teloschistes chrysophthalmus]|nr:MAG: hypothetical protein LQ350_003019 [Niorma chrysophthalma]
MSPEPRIGLGLTTQPDLVYDLWQGFLSDVYLDLQFTKDQSEVQRYWMAEYAAPGIDYETISPTWALTMGLLAIKDENGTPIEINNNALIDITPSRNPTVHFLRGFRINEYKLDRFPRRLLEMLRSCLRPGQSYTLSFAKDTFPVQAAVVSQGGRRLQLAGDDRWINTLCEDCIIRFQVVPGIRIPRFSVALSTFWDHDLSIDTTALTIELRITSLDRRAIKVRMPDPKYHLAWNGLASWVEMYDTDQTSDLLKWYCHHHWSERPTWNQEDGEVFNTSAGVMVFDQCKSYKVQFQVHGSFFNSITGDRFAIRIIPDQSGFERWKPFDEASEDPATVPAQWPSLGRIEFEPVPAGWDEIEQMLERERPMPLFRLPTELREEIYDCVKFGKSAETVLFTTRGHVDTRKSQ